MYGGNCEEGKVADCVVSGGDGSDAWSDDIQVCRSRGTGAQGKQGAELYSSTGKLRRKRCDTGAATASGHQRRYIP